VPSDLDAFYSSAKSPDLRCVDISLLGGLYVCYTALAQFRGQGEDKDGFKGKIILAGSEACVRTIPVARSLTCAQRLDPYAWRRPLRRR
jgi:hypothetical protein